jgi:CRP/FNR family nitrogen fixation transcriptional regulator
LAACRDKKAASLLEKPMRTSIAVYPAKVPAFHAMRGAANLTAVEAAGCRRALDKGAHLYDEGDPADHFYKVVSGTIRTYKLLSDGRRQINAFHLAGDILGIGLDGEHPFSAEAVDEVAVIAYPRSRLEELTHDDPAFANLVMSSMVKGLRRAQEHMLLLGRKNAVEKIGSFLLDLAERLHEDEEIELPMTRMDIADYLGLTIETVSRTLAAMSKQNVICVLSHSRSIELRDKRALRSMAA